MTWIKITDRDKPWARAQIKRDFRETRQVKNIFRIYCEGANTEPEYFKSFPVNTETLVEAVGLGRSRLALIQHILRLLGEDELLRGQRNYDEDRQIWCVFDRDERQIDEEGSDFDQAIALALENGLYVAYSNDCFELWFFLHDHYIDTKLLRSHFYNHLSERFNMNYEKEGKSKEFSQSLYAIFLNRQETAIKNATRLLKFHEEEPRLCRRNPCTTVFQLVLELNKCLKK